MAKQHDPSVLRARELLARRDGRASLVLAALAALTVSVIAFYVSEYALPNIAWAFGGLGDLQWNILYFGTDLLFFLLFWFFAMPLWLGMYRMAVLMTRGERMHWYDVFYYTAGVRLWGRAVGLAFHLLLPWLPCALSVMLTVYYGPYFGLLIPIALLLGLLLGGRRTGVAAYMVGRDSMTRREAKMLALGKLSGRRMRLFGRSFLQMLKHFLAIVLSVGVVFLLHTLPMAMLTASCFVADSPEFEN